MADNNNKTSKKERLLLVGASQFTCFVDNRPVRIKRGQALPPEASDKACETAYETGLFGDERDLAIVMREKEKQKQRATASSDKAVSEMKAEIAELKKVVQELSAKGGA